MTKTIDNIGADDTLSKLDIELRTAIFKMRDRSTETSFCGQCNRTFKSAPEEFDDYDCPRCGSQNTIF